jgi:hypothetical protein
MHASIWWKIVYGSLGLFNSGLNLPSPWVHSSHAAWLKVIGFQYMVQSHVELHQENVESLNQYVALTIAMNLSSLMLLVAVKQNQQKNKSSMQQHKLP